TDCDKFSQLVDSIRLNYWGENYNSGVKIIHRIDNEVGPKIKQMTDSLAVAAAKEELKIVADSGKIYFGTAITVDPSEFKPYEAIAIIYDRLKQFDSALVYFKKASVLVPDSAYLLQNIAYAYIELSDWDNAIAYFKNYLLLVPNDPGTLSNIAICYNNRREPDSAYIYNMKTIAVDSNIAGACADIGQYFLIHSQDFSDSIMASQKAGKPKETERLMALRDALLDSSAHY
ncbi:MAG: hypothetical protein NTV06_04775, partial [candidate division Zixibacteria bacterium]|nr:hypothetical protein [candidate division Zixibacteria bacterium]